MKRTMRHTYEIHAILTAIYCINETTVQDKDIANLLDYIFYRVYKESTCTIKKEYLEKQEKEIMNDLNLLLRAETNYEI